MDREVIVPENVYKTGGFSQAIKVGNVVYVAGVVGIDDNGDISNDPETQATQMWINIKNILENSQNNCLNNVLKNILNNIIFILIQQFFHIFLIFVIAFFLFFF